MTPLSLLLAGMHSGFSNNAVGLLQVGHSYLNNIDRLSIQKRASLLPATIFVFLSILMIFVHQKTGMNTLQKVINCVTSPYLCLHTIW